MSALVSQSDLEAKVLSALFEYAQTESERLSSTEVASLLLDKFSERRVRMALEALERADHIDVSRSSYVGTRYEISETGYKKVELEHETNSAAATGGLAPAADRIVSFDHNHPDASEIARGIEQAKESVRGANDPNIEELERQRVLHSLEAAQDLWSAASFRIIQLKIGILMAVEDAGHLLKATAKAASIDLLVEAIKAFARNYLKIDLDA